MHDMREFAKMKPKFFSRDDKVSFSFHCYSFLLQLQVKRKVAPKIEVFFIMLWRLSPLSFLYLFFHCTALLPCHHYQQVQVSYLLWYRHFSDALSAAEFLLSVRHPIIDKIDRETSQAAAAAVHHHHHHLSIRPSVILITSPPTTEQREGKREALKKIASFSNL